MSWDYSKLRGKIREVCGTQDAFADRIGIGRVSLSQRLNNDNSCCVLIVLEELELKGAESKILR